MERGSCEIWRHAGLLDARPGILIFLAHRGGNSGSTLLPLSGFFSGDTEGFIKNMFVAHRSSATPRLETSFCKYLQTQHAGENGQNTIFKILRRSTETRHHRFWTFQPRFHAVRYRISYKHLWRSISLCLP